MKHAITIVTSLAVLFGSVQLAAAADGKAVYDKSCGSCHNKGLMGAPKLGDKDKWGPLLKDGQAALDAAVMNGKGKMKPKGGNDSLTADDVKAANEYIASKAK